MVGWIDVLIDRGLSDDVVHFERWGHTIHKRDQPVSVDDQNVFRRVFDKRTPLFIYCNELLGMPIDFLFQFGVGLSENLLSPFSLNDVVCIRPSYIGFVPLLPFQSSDAATKTVHFFE